MTKVDDYLRELARELGLRTPHVRRILLETEDHLRESAREVGDDEAVARFGTPAVVAEAFARAAVARLSRWTAFAVGAAVVGVVAAYGAVENGAPPAPWPSADEAPDYLAWKLWLVQRLTVVGFAAAAVALAALLQWRHRARLVLASSATALAALGAAGVLGAIEAFQRAAVYRTLGVADTPIDLAIAGVVAVQLLPVLTGAALAARAFAWTRVSSC